MKKHLKIAACLFRLNLASALEYRSSFLTQAFGMALSNSSFIFFWWIAFQQLGGYIAGYSFQDVLFIWATTSSAFGLANVLFANAANVTKLIVSGELDAYLLQPCNVLVNVLCARTSLSAYGDLAYGFILMGLAYHDTAAAWLWFFVGVLLGSLLFSAVTLTAHTLSFYWGDASMIGQLTTEFVINFSIYPDKIYGPAVRALMYSLLPIGLAIHVPLRLFRAFSPLTALAALGASLLYCVLAGVFFSRGLRRYESGNIMATRL
ncbi:ABC-2 type transport system permease protein [Sporobacter termitidis DSM 10068]|uniref:ABC-2 type transport system permease protein n=1 Tax=Sporobacter termitidis DSM 10068 TaxID=1123282 RepID=A0A1M5TCH4_9FIRM|nr:ABC-2 family transporter protein [Sporobacter termitidis]SHH48418.1 ABC-2 type transport system permease protein [Sporobacter termitidis DSM 10068]